MIQQNYVVAASGKSVLKYRRHNNNNNNSIAASAATSTGTHPNSSINFQNIFATTNSDNYNITFTANGITTARSPSSSVNSPIDTGSSSYHKMPGLLNCEDMYLDPLVFQSSAYQVRY